MKIELNVEFHVRERENMMAQQWTGVLLEAAGRTEPRVINICDSLNEAKAMAEDDFDRLNPDEDPCPDGYEFHARTEDGSFKKVASFWV